MKKIFFLLAGIACSLLSYGQTNQAVWNNGRIQFGMPIVSVDSLTFPSTIAESDTFHFILPRAVHDTVIKTVTVVQHDTVYIHDCNFTPEGVLPVDLGLPSGIKWASCNVGATSPERYGNLYAWGELTTKEDYSWSTYKYANGTNKTLTKYCNDSTYGNNGFKDNKTTLDLEDDAAHAIWGGSWRVPTDAEVAELLNNCTWIWTTQNNVNGYLVTSKTNSNSIFLPAAGYFYGTKLRNVGIRGYYWSASLDGDYPNYGWHLYCESGRSSRSRNDRHVGYSIRPVCQ